MKKLIFVGAFLLSLGAFAQKTIEPEPDLPMCLLAAFEPECDIVVEGTTYTEGFFVIEACGWFINNQSSVVIIQNIQDYVCKNGKFPDYVKVWDYHSK
ncbi:hypothetical protein SAMN04488018_12249 [Myroides marinus]|uniref:Uncharacterized protein n=1 Tax=Myroides marinus TaxID=703342 RepID=A0A1H6XNC7_9FLAO|nr:hypothetical protein [Myroides marinus]SEJ29656.1 hypothetical protein SAMN04488018_12249 [Myroides marinus]